MNRNKKSIRKGAGREMERVMLFRVQLMRLPVCSYMKYELSETRSLILDLPRYGI